MSATDGRVPVMLTDLDRDTLDFEAAYAVTSKAINGAKDVRIRDTFDESSTRYYMRLNCLLDDPDALAYAPLLIKRLQRMREARRLQRHRASRLANE